MASKEDLSEQLEIMQKLTAQVERMARAAERVEKTYADQVDVMTKLAAAIGSINTQDATQKIEALNKSLQNMQEKAKEAGQTSEETFVNLGKKVDDTGKKFKDKFPKSVAIATGALTGFSTGVRNVIAMAKAFTGVLGTLVGAFLDFGASILSKPLKFFESIIDLAAKAGGGSSELAQAIEDLRKQFGALYGPTNHAIITLSKNMTGFKDTGLSTWRVFGDLAKRLNDLRELATEMGGTFGVLLKSFEDNGGAILAYQKGLGLSSEEMKGMAVNAIAMGEDITVALKDMTKQSYALGEAFGVDAKLISRDMGKAMTDVKHFGGATVKQIAEASTYARKLGFELKDITGTLDAFDTFDTAAENAAKLSQSFGLNLDAFKLMEAQDPATQLNMLRKSFKDAGVDASNFNRAQLKLVAGITGYTEAQVRQGLSMKNEGARLDEIKKKSGDAEKRTMTQAQAMAKLADAIERLVMSGGQQTGSFWDMFVKGFLGGLQASKEFSSMIWNIKRSLQETYLQGVRLGKIFVQIFPGVKEFFGGVADFFKPAKFRKMVGGVVDILEDWMKGLTTPGGAGSFATLMDKLQTQFFSFFSSEDPAGSQMLSGFKKFFKTFANVAAEGIVWASGKVAEGIRWIADLISGRAKLPGLGAGAESMGFLGGVLSPVLASLGHAAKTIAPALWGLLSDIGVLIKDFLLSEKFAKIIKPVLPAMALMLFGPGLAQSIMGLGADLLAGAIKKKIIQSAEKALIDKAVEASFQKATSTLVEKGVSAAASTATDAVSKTATSAASAGAGAPSGLASLLANPFVLVAAAAVAIAVGAFVLAKTSMKTEAEKLQDASDWEDFYKKLEDKNNSLQDRIEILKKERLKQAKIADEEAGMGVLNFLRRGQSEHEADARSRMESINKQLQEAKMKADNELIAGTPEYQAKMAKAAAENKKRILDAMGPVTVENAAERFKKVSDLAKQVTGKDFDLAEKMNMIRDKLDKVDFAVFGSKDKEDKLNLALNSLTSVKALFGVIADVGALSGKASASMQKIDQKELTQTFASLKALGDTVIIGIVDPAYITKLQIAAQYAQSVSVNMTAVSTGLSASFKAITDISSGVKTAIGSTKDFTAAIAKGGIEQSLNAVKGMVKAANDLNTALSDGNLNKIDIKTKLENVARAMGLGGKATYTVNPGKEVVVNINLHVTMDAGTVERVIIERQHSIIRDRINFATSKPTETGNNTISDTYGATPKEIGGSGTK